METTELPSSCSEVSVQTTIEDYIDNAILWARFHVGAKRYALKCLAFVEDAYEMSNGIELDGYSFAKEEADAFKVTSQDGVPPKGAFVFYDCWGAIDGEHKNWGHVGLSLGDGQIVHAWDVVRVDPYLDIEKLGGTAGWTNPKSLGWASVERIMEGMTERAGSR